MAGLAKSIRAALDHEDHDLSGYGEVRRDPFFTQQRFARSRCQPLSWPAPARNAGPSLAPPPVFPSPALLVRRIPPGIASHWHSPSPLLRPASRFGLIQMGGGKDVGKRLAVADEAAGKRML